DNASNANLRAFAHVGMARAGPYLWRWRLGPARFGSYRTRWGALGASVSTVRVTYALPASEALTSVTDYSSSSPLFFGCRVIDVQSPKRRLRTTALSKKLHSLPSSIRRGKLRAYFAATHGVPLFRR